MDAISNQIGASTGVKVATRFSVIKIVTVLFLVAIALAATYLVSRHIDKQWNLPESSPWNLFVIMFDLNGEGNVPAWYSSMLWVFAAILAVLNGAHSRQNGTGSWHWVALSGLFLLLSMDESASLHEAIGEVLATYLPSGKGFFSWSWIYYGFALVVASAVIFFKFLLTLPRSVFLLLLLGGAVFVGGALGIEMLSAAFSDETVHLPSWMGWGFLFVAEEFSEMTGVIIAIAALLIALRGKAGTLIQVV